MLNESSRDNLLLPYVEMLKSKGKEVTVSQLKQFLLAKFVNEAYIRNLSLESNYYLAGVARYYFEGKLTTNKVLNAFNGRVKDVFDRETCQKLNALILVLRNSYIDTVGEKWEQPEDFGNLPLEKLLRKYGSAIKKEISNDPEEIKKKADSLDRDNNVGNGYTYEILYSYEDARKYNSATEPGAWCITYGEQHYSYYVNKLDIHYVIFAKKGYEKIPRRKTEGWSPEKPQDEYGNSLIALLQSNKDWVPVYITSRWNHGSSTDGSSCEADHAYSTEEFFEKTGVSANDLKRIYEIWKTDREEKEKSKNTEEPNSKELMRKFKYAQMKLNGGNFENLFGDNECALVTKLSNCKNFKEIQEKVSNGGLNDEETAALLKKEIKMVKSSVALYSVKLFGLTYYFVRDGSKILFETIQKSSANEFLDAKELYISSDMVEAYGYNSYVYDIVKHKHNLLVIGKPSPTSYSITHSKYFMLYDYRRHSFVEIDGVSKFKKIAEVSNYDDSSDGYYEIANSLRQRALVNINTNTPVAMPNGRCWFEYSESNRGGTNRWTRSLEAKYHSAKCGAIKLIVDSSSGEACFYDMMSKKFFEPVLPPPLPDDTQYKKKDELCNTFIEKNFLMASGFSILHVGLHNRCYSLYRNGKPFEIDGEIFFNGITYMTAGFFKLYPMGENKPYLYDITKKNKAYVPDGINFYKVHIESGYYINDDMAIMLTDTRNRASSCEIIYDRRFNVFLKNPLYPGYTFKVHAKNLEQNKIKIYKNNNNYENLSCILTLNPREPKFDVELGEDGEPAFERLQLFESEGSIYSIGCNDIRKMVMEIINKIKN